jgi:hypothetical protein
MAQHSSRNHTSDTSREFAVDAPAPDQSRLHEQDMLGNQALQDQVTGLTGRTFNRIIGAADGDKTTAHQDFGKDELAAYIKHQLEFAKGEWFSSAKISGAADGVLEELDQNGNGRVSWEEFQTFRSQMIAAVAPGLPEGASAAEIQTRAAEVFHQLGETDLDYDALEAHTRSQLDPDNEHRDLIAQLGALLLLDAADLDEQSTKPKERKLTEAEWMGLASESGHDNT